MRLHKFEDDLYEQLRDPEFAVAYLDAAKEDGLDEFLFALREVASAQEGGIKAVAERSGVGRESLYKALSKKGNPSMKYVDNVLDAMGLQLHITKKVRVSA